MRSLSSLLFALTVSLAVAGCDSSDNQPEEEDGPYPSLKQRADFPVGVALSAGMLDDPRYVQIYGRVFDSFTAEWQMKPVPIWAGPGSYNWTAADRIVNFANQFGMRVHGHTLVWHSATPGWIENFNGSGEEFEALVREYIHTVVSRYGDRVESWDVVNEAINDGNGLLRNSVYRRLMGPDYVARCFEYAHEADPDALLFYNDYGIEWDMQKRQAMFALIDDLLARGVPIHGVGVQMHVSHNWPEMSQIAVLLNEIAQRNLRVHLSEVDVRINPDGDITAPTPARLESQKQRMSSIVQVFRSLPDNLEHGITFWGLRDPDSWLISFWGQPEWPLLFDADLEPKPAYFGFLEAL